MSALPIANTATYSTAHANVRVGQSALRQTDASASEQAESTQNPAQKQSLTVNPLTAKPSTTVSLSKNAEAWMESEKRFEQYKDRLNPDALKFLSINDRRVIGQAYEAAEKSSNSPGFAMEKIDKLANELVAFRIQQHMRGELVMVLVDPKDEYEKPPEIDIAHLPLLGEIRKMNGAGG